MKSWTWWGPVSSAVRERTTRTSRCRRGLMRGRNGPRVIPSASFATRCQCELERSRWWGGISEITASFDVFCCGWKKTAFAKKKRMSRGWQWTTPKKSLYKSSVYCFSFTYCHVVSKKIGFSFQPFFPLFFSVAISFQCSTVFIGWVHFQPWRLCSKKTSLESGPLQSSTSVIRWVLGLVDKSDITQTATVIFSRNY